MKTTYRRLWLCALVVCARLAAVDSTPAPRIPLEDFFAEDDARSMQLSADGHYAAFLTTLGWGKVGIALVDLNNGGKPEALVSAQDENIRWFFWKGSDYIVYCGDIEGKERYTWRSIAVAPPKPGGKRAVLPLANREPGGYYMGLLDPLPYDPIHFLAWGHRFDARENSRPVLVNVRNGNRTNVDHYDPDISYETDADTGQIVDNNGALRARSGVMGAKNVFEVRATPESKYVKVAEFPALEPRWEFLHFARDNETLYLLSTEHTDTLALHALNVQTQKLGPVLFSDPEAGEVEVLSSRDRAKLTGVFYNSDRPHYKFFDSAREKLQARIDHSLTETFNSIVSSSEDEQVLLVLAWSDREPGTYYVLDLRHGRIGPIARVKSRIRREQMRPMEPIAFKARDGLTVHGYLTRPAIAPGEQIPLIINPHGGPFGIRDEWGFNDEVQFLANRGFAVLQVNYRGSGGYGRSFEHAGYQEWGGKMQDDLTDAVQWALSQGFVDPRRVAIYGASYGGYAALEGLTKTPELYCCGVNYVGVTDLSMLVHSSLPWATPGGDLFYRQCVGANSEYLRDRSPVNFVEKIRVPLLNAYGLNDPRVEIRQWHALESKLKEFHKTYEILIEDNEGHGFHNEKNRIEYYRQLEKFLEKYLRNGANPVTAVTGLAGQPLASSR